MHLKLQGEKVLFASPAYARETLFCWRSSVSICFPLCLIFSTSELRQDPIVCAGKSFRMNKCTHTCVCVLSHV